MTLNFSTQEPLELRPRIIVVGVGGAGGNAVNNMISSNLEGATFVVANTDAQALAKSATDRRIQLGVDLTEGLGAGSRPDVGRAAAEEAIEEIAEHLQGCHMAFVTAGMGGGTGTGAAPVIARVAKEMNILTVGVVTKPFQFEGGHRMRTAETGIEELQHFVDTLIVIPNQNLFRLANEKTTFADAFRMADEVLHCGVRGITDLMVMPGLINLDFADVRTVMSEMGKAMMGTGEAEGENRAIEAANRAIANPLLDEVSMKGARGVLINITGGMDLTLYEVDEAANKIREEVDGDANIIVGSTLSEEMSGSMRVTVVATGIDVGIEIEQPPKSRTGYTGNVTPMRAGYVDPRGEGAAGGVAAASAIPAAPASVAGQAYAAGATRTQMVSTGSAVLAEETYPRQHEDDLADAFQQALDPEPEPERQGRSSAIEQQADYGLDPVEEPAQRSLLGDPEPQQRMRAEPAPSSRDRGAAEAPFVAPEPMRPPRRPEPRQAEQRHPAEPAPRAADESGQQGEPRMRRPSIFRRMTGVGITRPDEDLEKTAGLAAEPVAEPARPRAPAARPAQPAARPQQAAKPSTLGGLDPADRLPRTADEDDLLEIPAFLRRQAN
ncbi:MAG: cell division protein FtsZ [Sneathiellaceae bacterium]